MKSDKSMRLLTAFLALGILISGWGLLALESQHRADRAFSERQAVLIIKNQETINTLTVLNAANSKTLARAQREIELEGKQIAILEQQVIDMGGRPIIVVAGSETNSSTSPSSTKSSPNKKSPQVSSPRSPSPSPSPTPCILPICLKPHSHTGALSGG